MKDQSSGKETIRRKIWKIMEELEVARFPRPIFDRIPNFLGAKEAAQRLVEQAEFKSANVVKVNPDAPQREVRLAVLTYEKILIMPTPRLKRGFITLNPRTIPKGLYYEASTIRGAFKYGRLCSLKNLPKVDLIVAGSVAVSKDGVRIGKGGGYTEMEYGILRELNLIREETPILTTVHDIQVVDEVPRDPYDLIVDAIITPSKVIRIERKSLQPKGIFWDLINQDKLNEMPILLELKKIKSMDLHQR